VGETETLFAAYSNGSIRACNVTRSYAITQSFMFHTVAITAVKVTSDGQCLVSADASGKLVFTMVGKHAHFVSLGPLQVAMRSVLLLCFTVGAGRCWAVSRQ
jgi:WD40 repeat protein